VGSELELVRRVGVYIRMVTSNRIERKQVIIHLSWLRVTEYGPSTQNFLELRNRRGGLCI